MHRLHAACLTPIPIFQVWVRIEDQWQAGELRSAPDLATGGPASVLLEEGGGGRTITVDMALLAPANPKLQQGIPDLTHLSYLNEPGILFNLQVDGCPSVACIVQGDVRLDPDPNLDC